jgi:hypothetical protein
MVDKTSAGLVVLVLLAGVAIGGGIGAAFAWHKACCFEPAGRYELVVTEPVGGVPRYVVLDTLTGDTVQYRLAIETPNLKSSPIPFR